jgi:hypothetical protein
MIVSPATGWIDSIIDIHTRPNKPPVTAAAGCRSAQLPCEPLDSYPQRGRAWLATVVFVGELLQFVDSRYTNLSACVVGAESPD